MHFTIKTRNAQDAGAIGVIVADDAPGPLAGLGGANPAVTIPAVRVTQADGAMILASLTMPNGNSNGTVAQGRITMFTPPPFQSGSSVPPEGQV